VAELVRDAVARERWYQNLRNAGDQLFVSTKGKIHQVNFVGSEL
jgi:hypothetical protein